MASQRLRSRSSTGFDATGISRVAEDNQSLCRPRRDCVLVAGGAAFCFRVPLSGFRTGQTGDLFGSPIDDYRLQEIKCEPAHEYNPAPSSGFCSGGPEIDTSVQWLCTECLLRGAPSFQADELGQSQTCKGSCGQPYAGVLSDAPSDHRGNIEIGLALPKRPSQLSTGNLDFRN